VTVTGDTDIGSYTDVEIMEQLRTGYRNERFRFEHLDGSNQSLRFLTTIMPGARIDYQYFADIKRTITFRMWETEEESKLIKWERDRIRAHMDLKMPDGGWARRSLGVFLPTSPRRSSSKGSVFLDLQGYDQTLILRENTYTTTQLWTAGYLLTDLASRVLADNGITAQVVASAKQLPTEKSWLVGTTHAQFLQDIIEKLGYGSVWFDGEGLAHVEPYVLPENRTPEISYATDEFSITKEEGTDFLDLFKVPNRWTSVKSQPDTTTVLSATITNSDPEDPSSTVGRGRVITDIRTDSQAVDQEALNQEVRRIAAEAQQKYREIEFTTGLVPLHAEATTVQLQHDPLELNDVYNETKWSMDLKAGGLMTHAARKAVVVGDVT